MSLPSVWLSAADAASILSLSCGISLPCKARLRLCLHDQVHETEVILSGSIQGNATWCRLLFQTDEQSMAKYKLITDTRGGNRTWHALDQGSDGTCILRVSLDSDMHGETDKVMMQGGQSGADKDARAECTGCEDEQLTKIPPEEAAYEAEEPQPMDAVEEAPAQMVVEEPEADSSVILAPERNVNAMDELRQESQRERPQAPPDLPQIVKASAQPSSTAIPEDDVPRDQPMLVNAGMRMRVQGLKSEKGQECNGKVCRVIGPAENSHQFIVEMEHDGGRLSVKKDNLVADPVTNPATQLEIAASDAGAVPSRSSALALRSPLEIFEAFKTHLAGLSNEQIQSLMRMNKPAIEKKRSQLSDGEDIESYAQRLLKITPLMLESIQETAGLEGKNLLDIYSNESSSQTQALRFLLLIDENHRRRLQQAQVAQPMQPSDPLPPSPASEAEANKAKSPQLPPNLVSNLPLPAPPLPLPLPLPSSAIGAAAVPQAAAPALLSQQYHAEIVRLLLLELAKRKEAERPWMTQAHAAMQGTTTAAAATAVPPIVLYPHAVVDAAPRPPKAFISIAVTCTGVKGLMNITRYGVSVHREIQCRCQSCLTKSAKEKTFGVTTWVKHCSSDTVASDIYVNWKRRIRIAPGASSDVPAATFPDGLSYPRWAKLVGMDFVNPTLRRGRPTKLKEGRSSPPLGRGLVSKGLKRKAPSIFPFSVKVFSNQVEGLLTMTHATRSSIQCFCPSCASSTFPVRFDRRSWQSHCAAGAPKHWSHLICVPPGASDWVPAGKYPNGIQVGLLLKLMKGDSLGRRGKRNNGRPPDEEQDEENEEEEEEEEEVTMEEHEEEEEEQKEEDDLRDDQMRTDQIQPLVSHPLGSVPALLKVANDKLSSFVLSLVTSKEAPAPYDPALSERLEQVMALVEDVSQAAASELIAMTIPSQDRLSFFLQTKDQRLLAAALALCFGNDILGNEGVIELLPFIEATALSLSSCGSRHSLFEIFPLLAGSCLLISDEDVFEVLLSRPDEENAADRLAGSFDSVLNPIRMEILLAASRAAIELVSSLAHDSTLDIRRLTDQAAASQSSHLGPIAAPLIVQCVSAALDGRLAMRSGDGRGPYHDVCKGLEKILLALSRKGTNYYDPNLTQ